jgi:hypothetical protein
MAQVTNGTLAEAAERAYAGHRPWTLPEPWTPRTRPPLLGKRTERVFHSDHRPHFSQIMLRENNETKWYKVTKPQEVTKHLTRCSL